MSHSKIKLYGLWALLAFPAPYLAYSYSVDKLSYGQVLSLSGDISVKLLIVAMAVTPLRLAAPKINLIKYRRAIGVASFGYAGFHLWIYLAKKADISRIVSEGLGPDILTGWVAFFIFIALAVTSNNASVRKLGKSWKRLHRWIYPAAILVLLHWILTAFDPISAYMHAALLAVLEGFRLYKQRAK